MRVTTRSALSRLGCTAVFGGSEFRLRLHHGHEKPILRDGGWGDLSFEKFRRHQMEKLPGALVQHAFDLWAILALKEPIKMLGAITG